MAECDPITEPTDLHLLKSTKIVVYVEEAMQDILVVSYVLDSRFFQGILIDSSKRYFSVFAHQLEDKLPIPQILETVKLALRVH